MHKQPTQAEHFSFGCFFFWFWKIGLLVSMWVLESNLVVAIDDAYIHMKAIFYPLIRILLTHHWAHVFAIHSRRETREKEKVIKIHRKKTHTHTSTRFGNTIRIYNIFYSVARQQQTHTPPVDRIDSDKWKSININFDYFAFSITSWLKSIRLLLLCSALGKWLCISVCVAIATSLVPILHVPVNNVAPNHSGQCV